MNRGEDQDMNVQGAWELGISGQGVAVTILDDGIEKDHPDLIRNYDPLASTDINDNDSDPQPRYDFSDSNRHGTRCAGQVRITKKCPKIFVKIFFHNSKITFYFIILQGGSFSKQFLVCCGNRLQCSNWRNSYAGRSR